MNQRLADELRKAGGGIGGVGMRVSPWLFIALAVAIGVALHFILGVEPGGAITATATAALAAFGGLQIQQRRAEDDRRRALASHRAGYLAFLLWRQIRSWLGERPAEHEGLEEWMDVIAKGTHGAHFDRADERMWELLDLVPDLGDEAGLRVERILQHFASATNLLNEYAASAQRSEAHQVQMKRVIPTAEDDLESCIHELEVLTPARLLWPTASRRGP